LSPGYTKKIRSEEMVDAEMFETAYGDIGGYQIDSGSGPEDILANIRRLTWFREGMEDQGIAPENYSRMINIEDSEYDLLFYDYSPMMDHILGANETASLQLLHGALVNSTGHFFYMEGGSAFSSGTIEILSITHSEEKVSYAPDHQISEDSEQLPLSTAPHGVLEFNSVERDDTVSIIINVRPYVGLNLQIIKVYADGELYDEPIINVVR
jgi:hypothetical protein